MGDDVFRKLGSIVGIGVGSIALDLQRTTFASGETVRGRVVLKLTNKTEAKRLVAVLEATRERASWVDDGRGGRTRRTETSTVHRFEQVLDGERVYFDETYDLSLPLPPDAHAILPSGTLGDVARVVSVVSQALSGPVAWRVHVFLDVPWKANVKARVDIAVR